MRSQIQNLTRAALAAGSILLGDPIDGARALLGQVQVVKPTAASVAYDVTAERALLARFDRPSDDESSSSVAVVEHTAERALLGR